MLAEDLPGRGLIKEFYLRLTGIVRQYVEDTTGIRAPEQTTEEFLRDMRSRQVFPRERSGRLAEFLEAADLIKYAGQQPQEGQIDEAISRAREFVSLQPASRRRHGRRGCGLDGFQQPSRGVSVDLFRLYSPFWLLLAPVALAASLVAVSPAETPRRGLFQVDDLKGLPITVAQRIKRCLPYFYATGLCLVVVALARPQAGKAESRIAGEGIAIEIVLDTSGSMEALDFQLEGETVSRLTAVKHVIKEFVLGSRAAGIIGSQG